MDLIVLILSVLVSGGIWLRFLYQHDRVEPEPILVVIKIIFLGGLISTVAAGTLNSIFSYLSGIPISSMTLSFQKSFILSTFVGFNEEIIKAYITYLLVRNLKDLDEPIDAVIYATSVGLGFSVFENFQYARENGLFNLVLRSLTAMPLHIGLAAIWGYKIAEVKFLHGKNYLDSMRPAVVLAAVLHATYDFFQFYIANPYLPLLISATFSYFMFNTIQKKLNYLSTQSPFLKAGTCVNCGTMNPIDAIKCKSCGMNLTQNFYKICSQCLSKVPISESKCPDCNADLD
ncbi:MAG TPA: PrsW family glutamic-type intramembrane protease [Leptospiraceae bacterium]|nr:PrsW family glutamic-type intramembrane protease [Leptospiraceae bacterium]HMW04757.1 PrsW family glutamic-type intramembrane protease [Leptospiraceae bacterium]HMX34526.1 PrsW family glutamic-type intramembrane protease [Leptospiraceae bacterium]HMY33069.1 PrsW family glutamic-type intramembrane protease [Leptospiraceae bacterium]HMZ66704.1 PrsW family glutamic-type intramembrane protease [Leptospiraceae bacterium]